MTRRSLTLIKASVILACALPFFILVARILGLGSLGANPIQEVLHTLGKTGLNLLLLTLAITPLRKMTGLNWLVTLRRALGSCHALDIPFIFGSIRHPLALPFTGFTASASRLSRKMQSAWIRFARDGNPNHERLPSWTRYDRERRATMVLGRNCALDAAPLEAERHLFERWSGAPPPAGTGHRVRLAAANGG